MERAASMDINHRSPAVRPLTYISLLLKQQDHVNNSGGVDGRDSISYVTQLIRPLLDSLYSPTVLEAAHCLLLVTVDKKQSFAEIMPSTNNDIDFVVNSLFSVLERSECNSSSARENIMKDIVSVLNNCRDKYIVCSKLMEHVSSIEKLENRMFVLLNIYKTLVTTTLIQRMKNVLQNQRFNSKESNLESFAKEAYVDHCMKNPSDEFEEQLRCEILFCLGREFLLLQPDPDVAESLEAWIQVAIEISQQGIAAFLWKPNPFHNAALSELGKVMTKLCMETAQLITTDGKSKRSQDILEDLLNNFSQIKSEFGQLIALNLLSNYISTGFTSGKDFGDILFGHISIALNNLISSKDTTFNNVVLDNTFPLTSNDAAMAVSVIDSRLTRSLDVLLFCLQSLCSRFTIKLKDAVDLLESLLKKAGLGYQDSINSMCSKLKFAIRYDILRTKNNFNDLLAYVYI